MNIRGTLSLAVMMIALASGHALGQGMDWDKLPEPKHLAQVLDPSFLGKTGKASAGSKYVQVGAFRHPAKAEAQFKRISSAGLRVVLGREGSFHLVLMPETTRNTAGTLMAWAKRSGYPDAYVRLIK